MKERDSTPKPAAPQQPGLENGPNPKAAAKNFLIGLVVCTIAVVLAGLTIINFDFIKSSFVAASTLLSQAVNQPNNAAPLKIQAPSDSASTTAEPKPKIGNRVRLE